MEPTSRVDLSESMQMYLVTIARLRTDGQPLPLSKLADALAVSPVSVNDMCHKLQDQGLVIYRPYKGATLTEDGEKQALHILRRHRLWEVFLVDKLGFEYHQAHDIACQLEHATPNRLADRLDVFLEHPSVNPEGEPIPRGDKPSLERVLQPLTSLSAGQRGHVIRRDVSDAARAFLDEQGIRPGVTLEVVSVAGESMLVLVGGEHISLARDLAETVQLDKTRTEQADTRVGATSPKPRSTVKEKKERSEMQTKVETSVRQIPLHKLEAGQKAVVVRVGGKGPARHRMMDMGLVPGSDVEVVRVAPLGDPIEFTVKGYSLSLRKSEAKAITVEVTD
ncbi:MAG: FeoA domain-containing protein [Chloroflexota bacterium]|nr:FeoA domain-containing protein [Chloroflexota bacterium]